MSHRRYINGEFYTLTEWSSEMQEGDGGGSQVLPVGGTIYMLKLWIPEDITVCGHWSYAHGWGSGGDFIPCPFMAGIYAAGSDGYPTGTPVWARASSLASGLFVESSPVGWGIKSYPGGTPQADLDAGVYWSAFTTGGTHPTFGGDPIWYCAGYPLSDMGGPDFSSVYASLTTTWTYSTVGLPDLTAATFAFSAGPAPGQRFKVCRR